jgi:hypothetical protein
MKQKQYIAYYSMEKQQIDLLNIQISDFQTVGYFLLKQFFLSH